MKNEKKGIEGAICSAAAKRLPVVVTDENFSLLFRNRLAEKLLPPPWRLRRLFAGWAKSGKRERMLLAQIEELCYFVTIWKVPGGYSISFLEDPMVLQGSLLQTLFLESASLLEEWQGVRQLFETESPYGETQLSRIAARTVRARERMELVCRSIRTVKRKTDAPCVCSIRGLLDHLSKKLRELRVGLAVRCPDQVVSYVSPQLLLSVVLSFVQFALICGEEENIKSLVEIKGGKIRLELSVPEGEGVKRSLQALKQDDPFRKAESSMGGLPLLSIALLCREHGVGFDLWCEAGSVVLGLSLPAGNLAPQMFLGDRTRRDLRLVEKEIEKILFLNKKG